MATGFPIAAVFDFGSCHAIWLPRPGFLYAIKGTLRLKEFSLLWGGVPCSLLVFISMATSGRHLNIMGYEDREPVATSNLLLARFCLLAILQTARNGYWAVEQPGSSVLKDTPYMEMLMDQTVAAVKTFFCRLPAAQATHALQFTCSVAVQ